MKIKLTRLKVEEIRVDKSFARRLPEPSEGELEGLTSHIAQHGVIVPLVVTQDNLLMDGHRRLKIAVSLGIKVVPARVLEIEDQGGAARTIVIATNLYRRHLNEAQLADLGSSMLRVEKKVAKERMSEGGKKGKPGKKRVGNGSPPLSEKDRATDRAARRVGISRKTFERVEKVKKKDPKLTKRMLAGKVSVAGAARKVEVEEIKKRGAAESKKRPGLITDLSTVFGHYRCVMIDPAWAYGDSGSSGAAAGHYPTMTIEEICALPIGELLHPDGGHAWTWITWPKIRDGYAHRVMEAWGLDWVGEIVWVKPGIGTGRYIRGTTEVLMLGVRGKELRKLMRDDLRGVVEAEKGKHSAKPEAFRELVESASPGPRIEVFARAPAKGWDRYGMEA